MSHTKTDMDALRAQICVETRFILRDGEREVVVLVPEGWELKDPENIAAEFTRRKRSSLAFIAVEAGRRKVSFKGKQPYCPSCLGPGGFREALEKYLQRHAPACFKFVGKSEL